MATLIDLMFDCFLITLGIGMFVGVIAGIGALLVMLWNKINN
jgi:hypothetical protein